MGDARALQKWVEMERELAHLKGRIDQFEFMKRKQ